ncbi:carbonic anhydrase [Myxococcus qinghaiensis]|uniref:carbonic anhydrase n=1 Tax=Myxococcus qinghaiensis TaxID=2906758 RepID=UPI0020A7D429|nr:carbonic anhydrase [Myxococcus qinghaiensis]MCP3167904.1 hypothetical protein [Myxococcus qinghaiensis]
MIDDEKPFVSRHRYKHRHPTVLAIYCSDGRFTDAVEDLATHLGHERIDTLTIPGGPALLNRWTADYLESDTITRAARFLIIGHHIEEVLLLAHANCGYYQTRHGTMGPEFIAEQQVNDLRHAAEELQKEHTGIRVRPFYVHPEAERIHFKPVALHD